MEHVALIIYAPDARFTTAALFALDDARCYRAGPDARFLLGKSPEEAITLLDAKGWTYRT